MDIFAYHNVYQILFSLRRPCCSLVVSSVQTLFKQAKNVVNELGIQIRRNMVFCEICMRKASTGNDESRKHLEVFVEKRSLIGLNRSLCVQWKKLPTSGSAMLCKECASTLVQSERKKYWGNAWPMFVWKALVQAPSGKSRLIWSLLPASLRQMWADSYELYCASDDVMRSEQIVLDATWLFHTAQDICNGLKAVTYVKFLDENPVCSVRCPWGCSEFIERCQMLPFDKLVFLLVGECFGVKDGYVRHKKYGLNKNAGKMFCGLWPDYCTYRNDLILGNPGWKLTPCMIIDKTHGVVVLVCEQHSKGSDVAYLHPPRHPTTNLPTKRGDHLAFAVVQPRIIRPMKINAYSTSYQMALVQGGFRGLDSCQLTNYHRFDDATLLTMEHELVMLERRQDIKCKLRQHVLDGDVPTLYEESRWKEINARKRSSDHEFKFNQARSCCTFVPVKEALQLNKCYSNENRREYMTLVPWPEYLIRSYATTPGVWQNQVILPTFHMKNCDTTLGWLLCSSILLCPQLWSVLNKEAIEKTSHNNFFWSGVLLRFASDKVLKQKQQYRKNPYSKVFSVTDVCSICYVPEVRDIKFLASIPSPDKSRIFKWPDVVAALETCSSIVVVDSFEFLVDVGFISSTLVAVIVTEDLTHEVSCSLLEVSKARLLLCASKVKIYEQCWNGSEVFQINEFDRWLVGSRKLSVMTSQQVKECRFFVFEVSENESRWDNVISEYMKYIGNECHIRCVHHGFQLVVAPHGNGKRCMHLTCQRSAGYVCPRQDCCTYLCCACVKSADDTQSDISSREEFKQIFGVPYFEFRESTSGLSENQIRGNDGVSSEGNDGNISISDDQTVNTKVLDEHDEEDDSDSCDGSNASVISDSPWQTFLMTDGNDELTDEPYVCTNNTDQILDFERTGKVVPHIRNKYNSMSLYVIFNEHANLLIRRNNQLRPTKKALNFLQGIVSTCSHKSIPLLYPEGMIFPSIFWNQRDDGTIEGALPAGLLNDSKFTRKYGFADVVGHMRARLSNPSIPCSTNPRYIYFAFDALNNLLARGTDSRFILRRGFEHMLGGASLHLVQTEHSALSEEIDSRKTVNQLASLIREDSPTYFFTHTCNQSQHPGVYPINKWIEAKVDKVMMDPSKDESDKHDLTRAIHEEASVQLSRSWQRAGDLLMKYIFYSEEKPLGNIKKYWWRWEYQEANGNMPHIHALIWNDEDKHNANDLEKIRFRVVCSTKGFQDSAVLMHLRQCGVLPLNTTSVEDLVDLINRVQTHSCKAANYRCHKRTGCNGETKCRSVNYGMENPLPTKHMFVNRDPKHSRAAMEVLKSCGLIDIDQNGNITNIHDKLRAGQHLYPADAFETMSPFNPLIFSICKSAMNIQICDVYLCCRYLAKYVQGIDKNCVVNVKPTSEKNKMQVEEQDVKNTKVTGSSIHQSEKGKKKQGNKISGRALGIPEAISLVFRFPQVNTSETFFELPTACLETRPGMIVDKSALPQRISSYSFLTQFKHVRASTTGGRVAPQLIKEMKNVPRSRYFNRLSEVIAMDAVHSNYRIDAITAFSIRPPELYFVTSPSIYHKCFVICKALKDNEVLNGIHERFEKCVWIDGANRLIKVRSPAIPFLLQQGIPDEEACKLFRQLLRCEQKLHGRDLDVNCAVGDVPPHEWKDETLQEAFIQKKEKCNGRLPIVVIKVAHPKNLHKFLVHILLSMGNFSNEGNLFIQTSICKMFRQAGLLGCSPPTMDDVNVLTSRYVTEQLVFLPKGTYTFDRFLTQAHEAFQQLLLQDSATHVQLAGFLHTTLQSKATAESLQYYETCRINLATSLCSDDSESLHLSDLLSATKENPSTWESQNPRFDGQSIESYLEHAKVHAATTQLINNYCALKTNMKNVLISGGPGTGKTYRLKKAAMFCMARGLTTMITANMSDRAISLGGIHLHKLFAIKHCENTNPQKLADATVVSLNRNPEKLQFLMNLDALLFDELGNISAELLDTVDRVMRCIRNINSFMGGVLVVCSMDRLQLPPIKGLVVLASPSITINFRLYKMRHSVRAKNDTVLQRVIDISRMSNITEEDSYFFIQAIKAKCLHVQSFTSPEIPHGSVRVLGKHRGMEEAESWYYEEVERKQVIVSRQSVDIQSTAAAYGSWKPASEASTKALNRIARTPQMLRLHKHMMVQMTRNEDGVYSNTQCAIIHRLPSQSILDNWKPFSILLAPPGVKAVEESHICETSLQKKGWKTMSIRPTLSEQNIKVMSTVSARRQQYPIKPSIAVSIHAAMGNEYPFVVSKIDGADCSRTPTDAFSLWMREQVIVLLSRTSKLENLIFVGDPAQTAHGLESLLHSRCPYSNYCEYVETVLAEECDQNEATNVLLANRRKFAVPAIVEIPTPNESGFVYILIEVSTLDRTYIGSTKDLKKRLDRHNRGQGSVETKGWRWHIFAFISGFSTNKETQMFEREWQAKVLAHGNDALLPRAKLTIAKKLLPKYASLADGIILRMVECVKIHKKKG